MRSASPPSRRLLAVLALLATLAARAEAGPLYHLTDLGTLSGDQGSTATAINNAGQVVGASETIPDDGTHVPVAHPFLYSNGQMTALGQGVGTATAINNAGQVVGDAAFAGQGTHPFLANHGAITLLDGSSPNVGTPGGINDAGQIAGDLNGGKVVISGTTQAYLIDSGTLHTLHPPGSFGTTATAINASGQVVGQMSPAGFDWGLGHAYLYSDGSYHDLGTLGGLFSRATAINAGGQVVGYASPASQDVNHAFLYSGGAMHDLGTLGGANSQALGINASGQVVGTSGLAGGDPIVGPRHAFLDVNGSMLDLNGAISAKLGWTLVAATGINDLGQIVGDGIDANGRRHAFLLTPEGLTAPSLGTPATAPEPGTLVVFGILAAAGLWSARRRA